MKQTEFFGNTFENIDTNEIILLINKLKKNFPYLDLDNEDEESLDDSLKVQKNPTKNTIKYQNTARYPIYENGSFKEDINNFLNDRSNKSIKKIFIKIENEINKVYKSYILIENIIYDKITSLINFCENKEEFSKLQIISRIKEISEILEDSFNFIKYYLFYNYYLLKTILENMDNNLSKLHNVKSLSLIFLLKFFELPNNELSYMLMFKIFDEETLILDYIITQLKKQIILNQNSIENNIIAIDNHDLKESKLFNDESEEDKNETLNVMLDLMDTYLNKSYDIFIKINNINIFRALYTNYFIYLRGNYNLDIKNKLSNKSTLTNEEGISSLSSSELSDLMSINTLMDEEVIIKYFLNKKVVTEFLDFFKKYLPKKYKINKFLIIIHFIQYYSIYPIIIIKHNFYNKDSNNSSNLYIYLICYNIGIVLGRIFNSLLLYKKSLKSILIISNVILIISFPFLLCQNDTPNDLNVYLIINRFLYGLSSTKTIETKFLISIEPKIIIVKSIENFFAIKYISIFIAILYTSINELLKEVFFNNKEIIIKIYENIKLTKLYISEFIFICISLLIMIFNIIFFKVISVKDMIKNENYEKILIKNNEIKNSEMKKSFIFENTSSDLSKGNSSEDHRSVLSYGKSKLISKRNKRKAYLIDRRFRAYTNNANYEGSNRIFEELDEIIIKQNKCCSYINKLSLGLFITLMLSIINIEILMILIFTQESYYNIMIGLPFLIGYIAFNFINKDSKEIKNKIRFYNIIILIILFSEIIFYIIEILLIIFFSINFGILIFSIIITFFNIVIENCVIYLMSVTIPIEKCIFKTNVGNFFDLSIILFKLPILSFIFFMNQKKQIFSSFINNDDKIKIFILLVIGGIFSIIKFIDFYFFFYNIKLNSLTRIMNKISYEK